MNLIANRICCATAAWLLGGCATGTAPPPGAPVDLPLAWQQAEANPRTAAAPAPTDNWWAQYDDTALNQTVTTALQRNGDIPSAALKLRNAALRADAQNAPLWPTLSGNVNAGLSRPLSGPQQTTNPSWSTAWGVSWELDLWGRLRQQRNMAQWEHTATAQDREGVITTLAANVVRQYWQLAALNQRLAVGRQSLAHAQRTFDLTQAQYDAGAISGLDLAQARQALQSQELSQTSLAQQRTEARHALALLLDQPPGQLPASAERQDLPLDAAQRAVIAPGVPADVLARRPDLQAAELRLRAALANVQAMRSSFYPGISLTGGLGTSGSALSALLSNPVATLGLGLTLPFLNFGELRRNPQIAQNDYEMAIIGFRQSLLRALAEVENALASVAMLRKNAQRQTTLVAQARRMEEMNEVRWRAGATPLRNWLDAQEARRQAELTEVDTQLNLLLAQANLYQALGGQAPQGANAMDAGTGMAPAASAAQR